MFPEAWINGKLFRWVFQKLCLYDPMVIKKLDLKPRLLKLLQGRLTKIPLELFISSQILGLEAGSSELHVTACELHSVASYSGALGRLASCRHSLLAIS